jgi:pilus assembly protein Flp/PilA
MASDAGWAGDPGRSRRASGFDVLACRRTNYLPLVSCHLRAGRGCPVKRRFSAGEGPKDEASLRFGSIQAFTAEMAIRFLLRAGMGPAPSDLPSTVRPLSPKELIMIALYATLSTVLHTAKARLANEEKGATMVEYGLMVALIAIIAIGGVSLIGPALETMFTDIAGDL